MSPVVFLGRCQAWRVGCAPSRDIPRPLRTRTGGGGPSASSSSRKQGEAMRLTQMPRPPSSRGHCEVDQRPPTSGDRWATCTLSNTSRTPLAHMQGAVSGAGSLVPSKTQGSKGASPPPAAHRGPPPHAPAFQVNAQWALRGASVLNAVLLGTAAPNTTSPLGTLRVPRARPSRAPGALHLFLQPEWDSST